MSHVTENEIVRIIDELLKSPHYPIHPEAVQTLPTKQKLDLFEKLVLEGAIRPVKSYVPQMAPKSGGDILKLINIAGGPENLRLYGANLNNFDLGRMNLQGIELCGASMKQTILAGADLRNAKLSGASLEFAKAQGCNFSGADFSKGSYITTEGKKIEVGATNLTYADLRWADLEEACLQGANLKLAQLQHANLRGAKIGRRKDAGIWEVIDLSGAGVALEQLQSATLTPGIVFPHSLDEDFKEGFPNFAQKYLDRGECQYALDLAELFFACDPEGWETAYGHAYKGEVLACLDRHSEAEDEYGKSLECCNDLISDNPTDGWAYIQKSHMLLCLGRYKEALEASDRAITMNSHDAWAFNNKGVAAWRLGRLREAEEALREAASLNPLLALPRNNLERFLKEQDR